MPPPYTDDTEALSALGSLLEQPSRKRRRYETPEDYRGLYERVGKKYGVDPDLLWKQARAESTFNPRARSPKGAAGLAQFMPDTARQYGLHVGKGRDDRYNPDLAADAQARHMRDLLNQYKGDTHLALAAYNAGPGAVKKFGNKIPPYRETRDYVRKITGGAPPPAVSTVQPTLASVKHLIDQQDDDIEKVRALLDPAAQSQEPAPATSTVPQQPVGVGVGVSANVPRRAPVQSAPNLTENDLRWHYGMDTAEFSSLTPVDQQKVLREVSRAVRNDQAKKAAGQPLTPSIAYINQNRSTLGLQPRNMMSTRGLPVDGTSATPFTDTLREIASEPLGPEASIRRQVRTQVEADKRFKPSPTRFLVDHLGNLTTREQAIDKEVDTRASAEHDRQEFLNKHQREIDAAAAQYRADIRQTGVGPVKWLNEMLTRSGAQITNLIAGPVRAIGVAGANTVGLGSGVEADNFSLYIALRIKAEAAQQAAMAEGADRGAVSTWLQEQGGGLVGTIPELLLLKAGFRAPAVFGASGALGEAGRGGSPSEIIHRGGEGVAMGGLFELPVPGTRPVPRALARAATVGAGTTAIAYEGGATFPQALGQGATMAAFTSPELIRAISAPRPITADIPSRQVQQRRVDRSDPLQPTGTRVPVPISDLTRAVRPVSAEEIQLQANITPAVRPPVQPAQLANLTAAGDIRRAGGTVTSAPGERPRFRLDNEQLQRISALIEPASKPAETPPPEVAPQAQSTASTPSGEVLETADYKGRTYQKRTEGWFTTEGQKVSAAVANRLENLAAPDSALKPAEDLQQKVGRRRKKEGGFIRLGKGGETAAEFDERVDQAKKELKELRANLSPEARAGIEKAEERLGKEQPLEGRLVSEHEYNREFSPRYGDVDVFKLSHADVEALKEEAQTLHEKNGPEQVSRTQDEIFRRHPELSARSVVTVSDIGTPNHWKEYRFTPDSTKVVRFGKEELLSGEAQKRISSQTREREQGIQRSLPGPPEGQVIDVTPRTGEEGFINVGDLHKAMDDLRKRNPGVSEGLLRVALRRDRPELFRNVGTARNADVDLARTMEEGRLAHSRPDIAGREITRTLSDGRVVVENPANRTGISRVKPDFTPEQQTMRQAGKEIQRDYRALDQHPARLQGFQVASEDTVRNYLTSLYGFVRAHAPEKIALVQEAEQAAMMGKYGKAHALSERALSGTHDYVNQLQSAIAAAGILQQGGTPRSVDWYRTFQEAQRRIGDIDPPRTGEEGSLQLGKRRNKPPDDSQLSTWAEPIAESMWIDAAKALSEGRLKEAKLAEHVRKTVADHLAKQYPDWSGVMRSKALAEITRQVHALDPEANVAPAAPAPVTPMAEVTKRIGAFNAIEELRAGPKADPEKLIEMAKAKFPESFRTAEDNPDAVVDLLYKSIIPGAKGKKADTWREEIYHRLAKMELDAKRAEQAAREAKPAEQVAALGGAAPKAPAAPEMSEGDRFLQQATQAAQAAGGRLVNPEEVRAGKKARIVFGPEPGAGQRSRSLADTLEAAGREPGADRIYDVHKAEPSRAQAQLLFDAAVRHGGIDYAIEAYNTPGVVEGDVRTRVGKLIQTHLQIEAARTGDLDLTNKSAEWSTRMVREATTAGQAMQALGDYNEAFTLTGALDNATRAYQKGVSDPNATLPPEIAHRVNEQAVRIDNARKQEAKLEAKLEKERSGEIPTPPPTRKIKVIKKGGRVVEEEVPLNQPRKSGEDPGQAGRVYLGPPTPALTAAKTRKTTAQRTFTKLEKLLGKHWTSATQQQLELARIERRDATRELMEINAALAHKQSGYIRRSQNLTRSFMVSGITTATRNLQSQLVRFQVERLTDAVEVTLRKATGMQSDLHGPAILRNTLRTFERNKTFAQEILTEHPEQFYRLFNLIAGDVYLPGRNPFAKGIDRIFGSVEQLAKHANFANRAQEYHIRSAEFLAELELNTKKVTGQSLEQFVATHGADKIPIEHIKRAVDKSLEVTFSASPDAQGAMGPMLTAAIEFGNKLPPTMSPIPFPRWIYNSWKFIYQYNPTGLLDLARTGQNRPRVIARAMVGTAMLLTAYQARTRAGGEKWYEMQIPGFEAPIDMRPFGPFSIYLFIAEGIRRSRAGERSFTYKEFLEAFGASTAASGISISSIERMYNSYLKGNYDDIFRAIKTEAGEIARAILTPVRQVNDVVAQFDKKQRIAKETDAEPFLGPIKEAMPFSARWATTQFPDAHRATSSRPIQQDQPAFKVATGYRVTAPKNYLEHELDRLHFQSSEIRSFTGNTAFDQRVTEIMGPLADKLATDLQRDPRYQKASDNLKFVILRAKMNGLEARAKSEARRVLPDEAKKVREKRVPYYRRQLQTAPEFAAP